MWQGLRLDPLAKFCGLFFTYRFIISRVLKATWSQGIYLGEIKGRMRLALRSNMDDLLIWRDRLETQDSSLFFWYSFAVLNITNSVKTFVTQLALIGFLFEKQQCSNPPIPNYIYMVKSIFNFSSLMLYSVFI